MIINNGWFFWNFVSQLFNNFFWNFYFFFFFWSLTGNPSFFAARALDILSLNASFASSLIGFLLYWRLGFCNFGSGINGSSSDSLSLEMHFS